MGEAFYVYTLFREDGRSFYVGMGKRGRWLDHERHARSGRKGRRFSVIRSMQDRGFEVPKVKLHQGLTEAMAHDYEIALIAAIGRHPHGPLVNLTVGGKGAKHSPETRERISAGLRGKVLSPETRAKLSMRLRGRKKSSGTRAKMSAWQRGRKKSPEHCAKMSATARTRTPDHYAKIWAARRANAERARVTP